MNLISKQVNELRETAEMFDDIDDGRRMLLQAADTIETLSKKLQASNMELSAIHYGGGWILCSERLPEEYQTVLATGNGIVKQSLFHGDVFECEDPEFYGMLDDEKMIGCEDTTFKVIAWMPLPEPYYKT